MEVVHTLLFIHYAYISTQTTISQSLSFQSTLTSNKRYSSKGLFWLRRDALYKKFIEHYENYTFPPQSVKDETNRIVRILRDMGRDQLAEIFYNCYTDTINRSVALLPDGTTYIITGDIPLMWLRDSAAQVHHYLPLTKDDPLLQLIFEGISYIYHLIIIIAIIIMIINWVMFNVRGVNEGMIRRQMKFIQLDPYGSSFRLFLDFNFKVPIFIFITTR